MEKRFSNVQNRQGKALSGIRVTVSTYPALAPASIYTANGSGLISGSYVTTDINGYYEYYAADGRYTEVISGTGIETYTVNDISIEDSEADFTALAASSGSSLVGDNTGGGLWTTVKGFITYLLSSAGAAIVGFIQAGTGAVARTLQAKAREICSVADFDTGATDKAAAWTAACATARTVLVPKEGSPWNLISTVTVPANTKLVFEKGASFSTTLTGANLPTRFFSVTGSNVEFDGAKASLSSTLSDFGTGDTNGIAIDLVGNNLENIIVRGNCDLRYFTTCVRQQSTYSGLKNLQIEPGATFVATWADVHIYGNAGETIHVKGTRHPVARDWAFGVGVSPYKAAIAILGGYNLNDTKTAFSDADYEDDCHYDVVVDDIFVEEPEGNPVYLFNCNLVHVANNKVKARAGGGRDGLGYSNDVVVLQFCRNFEVYGNGIDDSGENGIDILSCHDGQVYGNTSNQTNTVGVTVNIADPWVDDTAITFTADTATGDATLSTVSSTTNLVVGQSITGSGIPTGTKILSIGAGTLEMTNNATATASTVTVSQGRLRNLTNRHRLINKNVKVFGNRLHAQFPVQVSIGHDIYVEDNDISYFKTAAKRLYVTGLTGDTTNGSASVTNISSTANLKAGVPVTGSGIPASTTVKTIDSATTITLSANATATASGVALTFGSSNPKPFLYVVTLSSPTLSTFLAESITHRLINVVFDRNRKKIGPELLVTCDNATETFTTVDDHGFETGDSIEFLSKDSASTQTFPAINTFTFTANTQTTAVLASASSTVGLEPGQAISGTDIPANTFIKSISGTNITMSAAATGTTVGVTVTVAPVLHGRIFYVIRTGAKTFTLATTFANAYAGTTVALSSNGSGTLHVREHQMDVAFSGGSSTTNTTMSGQGGVRFDPCVPLLMYQGGLSGLNGVLDFPSINGFRLEHMHAPGTAYFSGTAKANAPHSMMLPDFYYDGTNSFGARIRITSAASQTFDLGTQTAQTNGSARGLTEYVRGWVY